MNLKSGTTLQGGRYQIIELLGQGGFGITYLASQVMAGRKVCIKEYFPKEYYKRDDASTTISLLSQSQAEVMTRFRDKFVKEAQTIATLDHPHIIHIFDVFEENNTCYYVMEYIEGESLNNIVKREGALSEADAIKYIRCIASALKYLHDQKINHLDVKPGNIMVRKKDDRAILIDFGLSKHYDNSGDQTSSTPVGISHGYAPMEQYQTGGVSSFSPATDIYSLGATLYFLVTGKVPPQATVVGEEGIGTLPEHLSQGTRKAIESAMNFWRKDRPKCIDELLSLIDSNIPETTPTTDESTVIVGVVNDHKEPTPPSDEKTTIEPQVTPKITEDKTEVKIDNNAKRDKSSEDKKPRGKQSKIWWIAFIILSIGAIAGLVISQNWDYGKGKKRRAATHKNHFHNVDKKYADHLELPHGLDGYFDLDEAIAAAKTQNKPIFVDITGHSCNNCREMEASVWSNNKVLKYLEDDYIVCALYVDDKTELAVEDYYLDANGSMQTELGRKNLAIAKERWGVTWGAPTQPSYVLVTPDGEAMLMPAPMGYERDVDAFAKYLQRGLDNKKAGINYAGAAEQSSAGLNYAEVLDITGNAKISWKVSSRKLATSLDRYEIRFVGKIEDGFHGYPMDSFSAPSFFIGDCIEAVPASEISEPLADQLVEHHGEMVYKGKVEYVLFINGRSGDVLTGSVMATLCSDTESACTLADHSFELWLQ